MFLPSCTAPTEREAVRNSLKSLYPEYSGLMSVSLSSGQAAAMSCTALCPALSLSRQRVISSWERRYSSARATLEVELRTHISVSGYSSPLYTSHDRKSKNPSKTVTLSVDDLGDCSPRMSIEVMSDG